jgi:acyl transferase domain-containing protein/phosphopantetheinyl transferase (holo-ACP synthase)
VSDDAIAIVGMSCVFPEASGVHAFWRNIVGGVDTIGDAPPAWDAPRYVDSGRIKTASGGWLRDLFRFEPHKFGIMPSSLDGGEPDQFLALRVAAEALADAGYLEGHDHRDTGIVLGHSTYLHRGQGTLIQNHIVVDQTIDLLRAVNPDLADDAVAEIRKLLSKSLPQCNTDIAPGLVPNVMTGRIANRLNLKGPNYLVDAACSSSLLAVGAAIDELRAGRSSLMLAGGVNASLPPEVSVIFTQLGALSGRGKVRPFETGSDGTLLGEGLGVVVLKRLPDALRDGDRVYAIVRGVAQASDGRGGGLLAPTVEGETLAIRRAYDTTGIDPLTVGLVEAHGTGIPLGDKTEIAALTNVFGQREDPAPCLPIGSVKSMISHCIPAAGIAGLIKTALALHHKVLPPTLCDEVNPELGIAAPLYVNTKAAPWIQSSDTPRRAGIDSFGFGGINAHAILEEAPAAARKPERAAPWDCELLVFSAADKAALVQRLEAFAESCRAHPEWRLDEIAAALARPAQESAESHRLTLVVDDLAGLDKSIARAVKRLEDSDKPRWTTRDGAVYAAQPLGGQLAFIFPGEGSQYLGMLADLAMAMPDVREWLDFWAGLYGEAPGHRRTDVAFPPAATLTPERRAELEARLHHMDVGSESVFVGGQAMHAVLRRLGIRPDAMLGHSSGESSALAASGAIPWTQPAELGAHIRLLNAVYRRILEDGKIPTGALLTVGALDLATVQEHIAAVDSSIVVAMHNCSNQLVLFGTRASIDVLFDRLANAGGICVLLPFDRGYHTSTFQSASEAFREYYDAIELGTPNVPLYSCATADRFPSEVASIRDLAAAQWSTTVRFQDTIEKMFADGFTTFVEVGPSGNLTSFVNGILSGKDYLALASNVRRRGGLEQLLAVVGTVWAEQRPVELARLFEGRAIESIDLEGASKPSSKSIVLDNTMPKIRLGEADLARLRELVQVPAIAPAPEPVAEAPVDSVMPEYFRLMHTFLEQQTRVLETWQAYNVDVRTADETPTLAAYTSFLDTIVEHDHEHVVAHCHLAVDRDAFLRDHVLSGPVSRDGSLLGLSCVPLMVSLEILAEACALLTGRIDVRVIENVRATDWIALDEGTVGLQVRARVLDGEQRCFAELISANGAVIVSAELSFALDEVRCPALAPLSEHRSSVWNDEGLYTCGMFHGPLFQSIRHLHGWDDAGIDAQLSRVPLRGFFAEGDQPAFVLNPVLLDATGQLAAYWIAQFSGVEFNSFPSTIERIELYVPCPEDLPDLQLLARQRVHDPALATDMNAPRSWDFECVDAHGQPLLRITNLQNVYFPVPLRFYETRRDPLHGWLGHPTRVPGRDAVLLWELPMLPEIFCGQSSGIFLRILAHLYLSAEERTQWQAQTGNIRRRREWLLGRAAIKEAVRYWIYRNTGELLHPAEVVVLHDHLGAPYVDGAWRGTLADSPSVSLSHDAHVCMVALADAVCRIGVDREAIGRIRKPELVVAALTPGEQTLLLGLDEASAQDRLLRIWCAKEAAAKFLGIGLQGVPALFEVQFADSGSDTAWVAHAESSVHVDLIRDDTSIIALASERQS